VCTIATTTEAGEQKNQRVPEAQVVVDGADQHHRENAGKKDTGARWHDEDSALPEHDRQLLVTCQTEQPALQGCKADDHDR
jgi:hypothetical protein